MLPVLALGIGDGWEMREGGLWRRAVEKAAPSSCDRRTKPPPTPFALTLEQQAEARQMIAAGQSLRQVGRHFGVSYGAIWGLLKAAGKRAQSTTRPMIECRDRHFTGGSGWIS